MIGFSLGYTYFRTKEIETIEALNLGADEIDLVINFSFLKNKKYFYVFNEIYDIKKICNDKVLKVLIETSYLIFEEKILASIVSYLSNADFIKTSTGFSLKGAELSDVTLMKTI